MILYKALAPWHTNLDTDVFYVAITFVFFCCHSLLIITVISTVAFLSVEFVVHQWSSSLSSSSTSSSSWKNIVRVSWTLITLTALNNNFFYKTSFVSCRVRARLTSVNTVRPNRTATNLGAPLSEKHFLVFLGIFPAPASIATPIKGHP